MCQMIITPKLRRGVVTLTAQSKTTVPSSVRILIETCKSETQLAILPPPLPQPPSTRKHLNYPVINLEMSFLQAVHMLVPHFVYTCSCTSLTFRAGTLYWLASTMVLAFIIFTSKRNFCGYGFKCVHLSNTIVIFRSECFIFILLVWYFFVYSDYSL